MNRVIEGVPGCVVYVDDIVLYSSAWSAHMGQLRALLAALAEAGLVINLRKCSFGKATVDYLGHTVGSRAVRPIGAKVEAILKFPRPEGKRAVMRFLGMTGYYRRFCKNYSSVAEPLTNLLCKNVPFRWNELCQASFEKTKALLATAPVLAAPLFDRPFSLMTDACDIGVGAVLQQRQDSGVEQPVAFFSRKLNQSQKNYSTIEKEALSILLATLHFDIYITNGQGSIDVYTDHNPLTFLDTYRHTNQRLYRWWLTLQAYPLTVHHVRGKDNVVADALSRHPV